MNTRSAQTTKILLLRHGQSTHMIGTNQDRVGGHAAYSSLTTGGEQQAERVGEQLKAAGYSFGWTRVHTSPLRRTRQTARGVFMAGACKKYPVGDARLREQCLGEHEGMPRRSVYTRAVKEALKTKGADYRHPGKNADGYPGESLTGAVKRMLDYVLEVHRSDSFDPTPVLAVSHETVIRGLAAELALRDGVVHYEAVGGTELRDAFHEVPSVGPCACSLLVVEDHPSGMPRARFEYFSENPLPID